jgi:FkbM family methyltransferase
MIKDIAHRIGFSVVSKLDVMGLRRPMAIIGSLIRSNQSFSVDVDGHWINQQPEATFVSPRPHVRKYSQVKLEAEIFTWAYMPQLGDLIINIGSGIGEETVVFSKLVGQTGKVIAIEAHPETFACLEKTVQMSRLANVTAVFCAIADKDGESSISTDSKHESNSILTGGSVKVPSRSLDSIAEEFGVGDVDLIKMNIEGAEKLAVRGMIAISKRTKNLCISCHDFVADSGHGEQFRTKQEVRKALEGLGFNVWTRLDATTPWARDYLYAKSENRNQV